MSRRPDPDFDPRIADWLEADPDTAPPDLVRTVDGALPSIAQRRALRLPWRTLPMHRLAPVGAALVTVVVIGALAVTLNLRPSASDAAASALPPAAASPSATPAADAMAAYRTARNAVCGAAMTAKAPLEARYNLLWADGITTAQRTDAIAALRAFVNLNDSTNLQLDALTPPPDLLHDHVVDVAQRSDLSTLIAYELSLIDAGKLADAEAVDLATNPISEQTTTFETHNSLDPCP